MSRPKPTVIIEHINKSTYKSDQVLSSEGIWAVFYDSQPINLKTHNILVSYPGPKYKKVSFSNPGHAINLCGGWRRGRELSDRARKLTF